MQAQSNDEPRMPAAELPPNPWLFRQPSHSVRNAAIAALVAWVPLAVLSATEGLIRGGAQIPLLYDLAAHVRFLFALPLLIFAERPVGRGIGRTIAYFQTSGLISDKDGNRFAIILKRVTRFANSPAAIVVPAALTIILGLSGLSRLQVLSVTTWIQPHSGESLSLAGRWYTLVALPLYQFVVLRWLYRAVVWGWWLTTVSRLRLRLAPMHPDGAGGLGFLGRGIVPFGSVGLALSSVLAAALALRFVYAGADTYRELQVYGLSTLIWLAIVVGPTLLFAPCLHEARRSNLTKFGLFATSYAKVFRSTEADNKPRIDVAAIRPFNHLSATYRVIAGMKLTPVSRKDLVALMLPNLLPAVPLAATTMPLKEVLKALMRIIA
jgi:hypothetical protein